ncbi:MAG: ABC transporter ATP-binding protein [Desulfobacteraceae bacterium]|nr:ABC transporter ATP-binding protein [Desulfobacteraceae bacterium]
MNNASVSSGNGESLIYASGLTKNYGNGTSAIPVLHGVDLSVSPGEMVAIMGPSGSGKSTLLFVLGLFLSPTGGTYRALGEDVLKLQRKAQAEFRRRYVGFVFQSCNLVENSTVYENLELPLIYAGINRNARQAKIEAALERVDLSHRIRHPANLLSGGEQQRVAVARALVNNPRVILADEPTGQLDRKHSQTVMNYFRNFVMDGTTAMVIVTHDPEVASYCTRVHNLSGGMMQAPEGVVSNM